MKASYLPPVSHVVPLTIVRRDRTLPFPGTVTARLNERVQAVDVIAEAETAPRHIFLDLARGLGVSAKEAPGFLVSGADLLLEALNRVRERIQGNPGLSDEQRNELIANIDVKIANVEAIKAEAGNMTNATAQDVRDLAKELREESKESRKALKRGVGHVIEARLGNRS